MGFEGPRVVHVKASGLAYTPQTGCATVVAGHFQTSRRTLSMVPFALESCRDRRTNRDGREGPRTFHTASAIYGREHMQQN
jgi:hypothetical protein